MRPYFLRFFLLALTQITGSGVVGILPVVATRVAAEFGTSLPTIFLGTSAMFIAWGLPLRG